MNKQIIIMLVAACTTALWGIVHSSQASMTTRQMPTNTMTMVPTAVAPTMPQTTSTTLSATAQSHFDIIDMSGMESIINEARQVTDKFKIHAEIETLYLNLIKAAYELGFRTAFMVSGQYMQAGLNAMINKLKTLTVIQPARPISSN